MSLLFLLWLSACGSSHGGENDASLDATPDARSDAISDARADVAPDRMPPVEDAAPDAPPDGAAEDPCSVPSDCVLVPMSCCGRCGVPSREDAIALTTRAATHYRDAVCEGVACPDCAGMVDPTLLASCVDSRCVVIDLYVHPSTACDTDDDCYVRTPECCECGASPGPTGLIAASRVGTPRYESLVCDPGTGCDACVPTYSELAIPVCTDDHCRVTIAE